MSIAQATRCTSRQRLLTALSCGVPDRVPVSTYELVGFNSHAPENKEPSYQRLMERIRRDTDCIAMWWQGGNEQFLASSHKVEREVQRQRTGNRTRTTVTLHTPKGDLQNVSEVEDGVWTTWTIEHWCKCTEDVDKALSVPYEPVTYDSSDLPRLRAEVGQRGIIMPSLSDPAYAVADLMKFQDFTEWAFTEPDHFGRATQIVAERMMENLRRQLDSAGAMAELYRICGPEYFTPPYLPPAFFDRFVRPYVTEMTDIIHAAGAKVRLHCHGKIGRVLDMILATGCDGIDPCEPPPDGDLELSEVKRRCAAAHVSVFGNIELKVLEAGTPADVRRAVKEAMDAAKEGGGFVLMPTAAPINVPLAPKTEANYFAYIDAALEYGRY